MTHEEECLNPCSNGILKYIKNYGKIRKNRGLNPCSNGILKYFELNLHKRKYGVLILVLMEY